MDPVIYEEVKALLAKVIPLEEERHVFQQWIGYCLRGDHPEKLVVIFKDKSGGGNGKSKTCQLILRTWGTYAKEGNPQHIYKPSKQADQNCHNASVFGYVGARVAPFKALDDKNTLDTKTAKLRNGGNASGSHRNAHAKHDQVIQYSTKWILIFNDKCEPKYDTNDEAWMGRLMLIPFRPKFFNTETDMDASDHPYKYLGDVNLEDKSLKWRPYFLRWAIEGHAIYQKEKFCNIPTSCKEWLTEISRSVDNLEDFVEDN
ncbi:hypothetical protein HDV00_001358, partial [Rhizophlyctis rosea]